MWATSYKRLLVTPEEAASFLSVINTAFLKWKYIWKPVAFNIVGNAMKKRNESDGYFEYQYEESSLNNKRSGE